MKPRLSDPVFPMEWRSSTFSASKGGVLASKQGTQPGQCSRCISIRRTISYGSSLHRMWYSPLKRFPLENFKRHLVGRGPGPGCRTIEKNDYVERLVEFGMWSSTEDC